MLKESITAPLFTGSFRLIIDLLCQSYPTCVVSRLEANGEKAKEMERQSGGGAVVL
jgi:hypothetical protein